MACTRFHSVMVRGTSRRAMSTTCMMVGGARQGRCVSGLQFKGG